MKDHLGVSSCAEQTNDKAQAFSVGSCSVCKQAVCNLSHAFSVICDECLLVEYLTEYWWSSAITPWETKSAIN